MNMRFRRRRGIDAPHLFILLACATGQTTLTSFFFNRIKKIFWNIIQALITKLNCCTFCFIFCSGWIKGGWGGRLVPLIPFTFIALVQRLNLEGKKKSFLNRRGGNESLQCEGKVMAIVQPEPEILRTPCGVSTSKPHPIGLQWSSPKQ